MRVVLILKYGPACGFIDSAWQPVGHHMQRGSIKIHFDAEILHTL